MKEFKGKAIYNPSGKAGEYSYWACNFYVGCSCMCEYCFNKKGRGAKILGGNTPTLKTCFKDEDHALDIFRNEVLKNVDELRKHGLFFSFTTDPMLPETHNLTKSAVAICQQYNIPVKILTKRTEFAYNCLWTGFIYTDIIAFGFTLTGHDELEPGASTNQERIEAMKKLHDAGFKTFASIEPIIDFPSALDMFEDSIGFCDLYKIGLMSGEKHKQNKVGLFVECILALSRGNGCKVYFKDSLLKQSGVGREDLPKDVCVSRAYNLFGSP